MPEVDLDAHSALEFIEKTKNTTDRRELDQLLHKYLFGYGFEKLTLGGVPQGGENAVDLVYLNSRPCEYIDRYVAEDHLPNDPVMKALRTEELTYTWDEVINRPDLVTEQSAEVVGAGRDFGMLDGLMVPVQGMMGRTGYFSISGRDPNLSNPVRSALTLVGVFVFQSAMRLPSVSKTSDVLTPRERDVLSYAANGRTNGEIAELLKISSQGVEFHLRSTFHKFEVRNRTAAVVQAIKRQEINV